MNSNEQEINADKHGRKCTTNNVLPSLFHIIARL